MSALGNYIPRIEELARKLGLDYFPVDFEMVPNNFMMEIAVYGLPVRMPHWSFGVRYIHQLVRQTMGHSRIFEVMFPGNPCHAYLVNANSLAENVLVTAHVIGHADFSKNNQLFERFHKMGGGRIVEQSAERAHRIEAAVEEFGKKRVEAVLDAALALEPHIDLDQDLHRSRYPTHSTPPSFDPTTTFVRRFQELNGPNADAAEEEGVHRLPVPPHPEKDLLWFIAQYGPELEPWERDIFLAVREEAFYFYPVFACQIMNEGWASYWHARLLREADFLPQDLYLDAIKAHSDVVRPIAAEQQTALSINPYHLGFMMWEKIIERDGLEAAKAIMREEDDFGFVRNYLDRELAEELGLFVFDAKDDGEIKITSKSIHAVREAILSPKFNFGAPRVAVTELRNDGTLVLEHDYQTDARGLDATRARKVLDYIHTIWRRPVKLHTVDGRGAPREISSD
jgi:stage V sporulation protein R